MRKLSVTNQGGCRLAVRVLLAAALFVLPLLPAFAQAKLEPIGQLENSYQTGQAYTIRMKYTDPDDEKVSKNKALFIDESGAGRVPTEASAIEGTDVTKGVTIVWDVKNLAQGSHKAHFEVSAGGKTVRYPEAADSFYTFGVEALGTKFIILGVGLLVGLAGVPFIVFFLSRSMNPRGDPSNAARVGLLFGILACCALFIYLFANVYGALVWAILIVGIIAAAILMTRRR
jgi:hypothetical protein